MITPTAFTAPTTWAAMRTGADEEAMPATMVLKVWQGVDGLKVHINSDKGGRGRMVRRGSERYDRPERPPIREEIVVRAVARRISQEPQAAKVPEITAAFWVLKFLTTAGGEATSDYFATHNHAIGALVEISLILLALWLQFRSPRYFAPAYWFLALAIATSATGVSDTMHLTFGIPYAGTTAFWAVVLAFIFWQWNRTEGTLSIHSITTNRRERYYWSTVFATFALGTAVGDLTANTLHLGYLSSAIAFSLIILIPAIGWWRFGLNEVFAFWFAYVVTRPIGASFADYFSKNHALSGANFGDAPTAGIGIAAVVIGVAYVAIARNDIQPPRINVLETTKLERSTPGRPEGDLRPK